MDVLARLDRTTDQIVGRADLLARLASNRPLRIKFGADCTGPELHLGNAVNLWMMRYLQDLGHVVVFLLGDVTSRIGDPTGRDRGRPALGRDEIERNAEAFLRQVTIVLRDDPAVLEIRRNSEWYDAMPSTALIDELGRLTHGRLIARDMFGDRIRDGREIAMHELIYPVLQGFDSVMLESDLTIVGSDQLFNETIARELQAKHGQVPQTVITSTITPGLAGGPKQSKSLGNYVGLAHDAAEKFGRLMTLNDDLVGRWARVYTELPRDVVDDLQRRADRGGVDARDAKLDLAEAIVARYHGAAAAGRVRREFLAVFSERHVPDNLPEIAVPGCLSLLELVALARPELSRSAARRLIAEGGARLNGTQLRDPYEAIEVRTGEVLRTGKRCWFRLRRS